LVSVLKAVLIKESTYAKIISIINTRSWWLHAW